MKKVKCQRAGPEKGRAGESFSLPGTCKPWVSVIPAIIAFDFVEDG
jgi:hypothetical protein